MTEQKRGPGRPKSSANANHQELEKVGAEKEAKLTDEYVWLMCYTANIQANKQSSAAPNADLGLRSFKERFRRKEND